jgi:hypothetical protein
MMNINDARAVRDLALRAIENLTEALNAASVTADADTLERIRKGVGISIGTIDGRLLSILYQLHPELDHLKHK